MGETKQINIKNRSYYFCNNLIDLEDFDAKLLKLTKSHTKTLIFTTLDTAQLEKVDDYGSLYNVNLLHLNIYHDIKFGTKWK